MNKIRKLTSLEKKQKDRLIKAKKDTKTLRKKSKYYNGLDEYP